MSIMCSIEAHNIDSIRSVYLRKGKPLLRLRSDDMKENTLSYRSSLAVKNKIDDRFQIELFHEQLPLPVPCYDLFPVTELTVGPPSGEISSIPGSLELTGGEY